MYVYMHIYIYINIHIDIWYTLFLVALAIEVCVLLVFFAGQSFCSAVYCVQCGVGRLHPALRV